MEILLNKYYGGYGLSLEAKVKILQRKGIEFFLYYCDRFDFYDNYDIVVYKLVDCKKDLERFKGGSVDKVLITTKYFGKEFFGNNDEAFNNSKTLYDLFHDRLDKDIIAVVKELKEKASGLLAKVCIIKIPDDCYYVIKNYDGVEMVYYSKSEIKEL